jgi:type II secretory pathway pseudopilin PulG
MNTGTPRRRCRRRGGIMLIEVLLALASTAVVATAVASLLFTVASASRDRQDLRRQNVRADVLAGRLDAVIRSSSMLLGYDDKCLVLWVSDSRANGKPDLSELCRIEWDPATRRLQSFRAPADLADADNTTFGLATDFVAATQTLKGTAAFPGETWATGVTAWSSRPAAAAAQDARMISYSVTVSTATGTATMPACASLRGTSVVER